MEQPENTIFAEEPVQVLQVDDSFSPFSEHQFPHPHHEKLPLRKRRDQNQNNTKSGKGVTGSISQVDRRSASPEKRGILDEGEIKKLNAWKKDSKCGDFIEGTLILPCKAFLSEEKWMGYLTPEQRFELTDVAEMLTKRNLKIHLVIDLNRSFDYYDFEVIKAKYPLLVDTQYIKFKLENAAVPNDDLVDMVYELLKQTQEKGEVVIMHCFNGINRTGYIISDFLCRHFGISGEEAVRRFENARNHRIEHQCMVEKLKAKYPSKENHAGLL